ncbi:alpha/beta hydrolase [Variovorax sp. LT1R16]|uniref:alpha/beta hydrolase n=1 Tax=Variovorax sp. LT1R16 TaxID=3443728 RepID=UPI003F468154
MLGAKFDADVLASTRAIYRPHLDLSEAGVEQADVTYGAHARHRLDMYRPAGPPWAVVVFVHGGGFVAGDKNGDGVFYRNIGRWLARHGVAAVLPNYRLAPEHAWPAGAVDVQAVLEWVQANRETLGGGAAPIAVLGQSAGASHVASWLFDDAARGTAAVAVDAVMLMSGFYSAEAPLPAGPRAYFGDDVALYASRSPLTHVQPLQVPLWLGVAELDPGWIGQHTYALARAVTLANGRSPDFQYFRGHNHVSTVQSLGSPQMDVGSEILRFLRGSLC